MEEISEEQSDIVIKGDRDDEEDHLQAFRPENRSPENDNETRTNEEKIHHEVQFAQESKLHKEHDVSNPTEVQHQQVQEVKLPPSSCLLGGGALRLLSRERLEELSDSPSRKIEGKRRGRRGHNSAKFRISQQPRRGEHPKGATMYDVHRIFFSFYPLCPKKIVLGDHSDKCC